MKNLAIVLLSIFTFSVFAQKGTFTPDQRAEIKTKKMILVLDLNQKQQEEILVLNKKYAPNQINKNDFKKLSNAEKFELKSKQLDTKIAYQSEMKKILTKNQFELWRKSTACHNKPRGKKKKNS